MKHYSAKPSACLQAIQPESGANLAQDIKSVVWTLNSNYYEIVQ